MDQQALNSLGYIQTKGRHLITPDVDLSVQEDIEGLSVVSRVNDPRYKVHDLMLISLIKYKRIKALSVLRNVEDFLERDSVEEWRVHYTPCITLYGIE